MKYEEMDCGIRVNTPKGEGIVKSYTAEVTELRKHFDFLDERTELTGKLRRDMVATVELDSGGTKDFPIKKLTRIEGGKQ